MRKDPRKNNREKREIEETEAKKKKNVPTFYLERQYRDLLRIQDRARLT